MSPAADGKIDLSSFRAVELGGMSTSTPVVYNGRAYVGVSGTSQFGAYSGHRISVVDLDSWQTAYSANTMGYPQTSGLVSTAYEKDDGYVYVCFMDNYTPGVMRCIKDKKGQTELADGVTETYNGKAYSGCAPVIFTPRKPLAQYCIGSPVCDDNGTVYFKNDSGRLIAIGSKVLELSVVNAPSAVRGEDGN